MPVHVQHYGGVGLGYRSHRLSRPIPGVRRRTARFGPPPIVMGRNPGLGVRPRRAVTTAARFVGGELDGLGNPLAPNSDVGPKARRAVNPARLPLPPDNPFRIIVERALHAARRPADSQAVVGLGYGWDDFEEDIGNFFKSLGRFGEKILDKMDNAWGWAKEQVKKFTQWAIESMYKLNCWWTDREWVEYAFRGLSAAAACYHATCDEVEANDERVKEVINMGKDICRKLEEQVNAEKQKEEAKKAQAAALENQRRLAEERRRAAKPKQGLVFMTALRSPDYLQQAARQVAQKRAAEQQKTLVVGGAAAAALLFLL